MDGSSLFGLSQRIPPSNLEAEQALLGALMANNRAFERVAEFLAPEHFADPLHGAIYAAIQRRIQAGQVADAVTLRPEFEANPLLEAAGGPAYLAQLLGAMVSVINAGEYGRVIHDCWLRRQLVDLGEEVVNRAFGAEAELAGWDQLEAAEARLFALADGRGDSRRLTSLEDAAAEAVEATAHAMMREDGLSGLTTGLAALDEETGGLQPPDLTIIAGRPAMGKTALATVIAVRAAHAASRAAAAAARGEDVQGRPTGAVLFISAEMKARQLAQRAISGLCGLPLSAVTRGRVRAWDAAEEAERYRRVTQAEFDRIAAAQMALAGLPLIIDDTSAPTVAQIRTRARRVKRSRQGLSLIVVDYLQILRASAEAQRKGSQVAEISEISAGLKALAKELDVPVIALSQLSREVEKRADKRPLLADLRDSGSIEQDADNVIFVYREHYYAKREMPQRDAKDTDESYDGKLDAWARRVDEAKGKAEAIIAKQRMGPTCVVNLRFQDETTWFRDLREDANGPAVPGLGEGA